MLEHLRLQAVKILASTQAATLSTSGPAGIQAQVFPCEAHYLTLFFLIPVVSDHLLNLEYDPAVVVSTVGWQLKGNGRILPVAEGPTRLKLSQQPEADGCVLVEIRPSRLQINRRNSWGFSDTLDFEP